LEVHGSVWSRTLDASRSVRQRCSAGPVPGACPGEVEAGSPIKDMRKIACPGEVEAGSPMKDIRK